MKGFKYLTLLIALFMINIMYAELKTFGMPSDTETEEIPSQETPVEEVPNEETPNEEAPSEEAPVEEDEIPKATEDSEVSTDQPIKFKEEYLIGVDISMPIFVGSNLDYRFDAGMGMNFSVNTPFSFKLMDKEVSISGSLSFNNFTIKDGFTGASDYKPMLIGVNLSTGNNLIFDLGTGLSMASGNYNLTEEYSMTTLYISTGINYQLPTEKFLSKIEALKSIKMSVGADLVMIMGAPDETGDSSNMINLGMKIGYPFYF